MGSVLGKLIVFQPAGVAVDDDGFVYVCDCFKDEVVVL